MQNRQKHYSHNERRFDKNTESRDSTTEERAEQPSKFKNEFVKAQSTTYSTSHLLGFVYNLALLYLVYNLVNNGEKTLALIIFSVNALTIILAILLKVKDRRNYSRNNHRRHNNNRNRRFNNNRPSTTRE